MTCWETAEDKDYAPIPCRSMDLHVGAGNRDRKYSVIGAQFSLATNLHT